MHSNQSNEFSSQYVVASASDANSQDGSQNRSEHSTHSASRTSDGPSQEGQFKLQGMMKELNDNFDQLLREKKAAGISQSNDDGIGMSNSLSHQRPDDDDHHHHDGDARSVHRKHFAPGGLTRAPATRHLKGLSLRDRMLDDNESLVRRLPTKTSVNPEELLEDFPTRNRRKVVAFAAASNNKDGDNVSVGEKSTRSLPASIFSNASRTSFGVLSRSLRGLAEETLSHPPSAPPTSRDAAAAAAARTRGRKPGETTQEESLPPPPRPDEPKRSDSRRVHFNDEQQAGANENKQMYDRMNDTLNELEQLHLEWKRQFEDQRRKHRQAMEGIEDINSKE